MNQQNQVSGSASNTPMKRKRGRPRKEGSVVQGENVPVRPGSENVPARPGSENVPVRPGSDNVMSSNQTAGTTDDCDDAMVGKPVTGVIEGTFNAGYLLNVKVADTDAFLRGLVFLPDQVAPVTVENDVAPHVKMIQRKEVPIPVPNPQAEIQRSVPSSVQCSKQSFEPELPVPISVEQVLPTEIQRSVPSSVQCSKQSFEPELPVPISVWQVLPTEIQRSVPSSVQCSKQSFEPELPVPISVEQVLPTESHSGISGLLQNQPASTLVPISISSGEIPPGTSEPGLVNQSAPVMSELDHDKTVKQGETLHGLDASTRVKEFSSDGGETKHSEAASEIINPVPSIENTNKELRTGQQPVPFVHQLNEVARDEPNISNIEFNLIPLSAVPEAMPSEQTNETVNYFTEKQELQKTDVPEDTNVNLKIDTSSNVDSSNSDGRPSTGVVNIPVVGSTPALETSHPEFLPSEQTSKTVTYLVEKQESPKTDVLEDTKTKLASETSSHVDTSNSSGRPSTDVVHNPVAESNYALETSQPESMSSEQVDKSVPS